MKKTILLLMSFSALTILSCNKEVAPSGETDQPAANEVRTITVNLVPAEPEDEVSKTTLTYPNGIGSASQLIWEVGDQVSYWTGTSVDALGDSKTGTIKDNGRFDAEVGKEDTVIKIKYPAVTDGTNYSAATSVAEEQSQVEIGVFNGENLPLTGSATFGAGEESINVSYSAGAAVVRWALKGNEQMLKAFSMNLYNNGFATIERYNVILDTPVELSSTAQYVYLVCKVHNNTFLEPGSFTLVENGADVVYTYCGAAQSQRNGDAANANNSRLLSGSMSRVSVSFNDDLFKKTVDLSADETSNCYIVSEPGAYSFDAKTCGNGKLIASSETTIGIESATIKGGASANALWILDDSDANKTATAEVVKNIKYENGRISFVATAQSNGTLNKGNALIALKDSEGKILWSWHIWITDTPAEIEYTKYPEQTYIKSNFYMLDRNVGAVSADPADGTKTYGFHYQWGRKDPFPRNNLTIKGTDNTHATIVQSIENPTTFYVCSYDKSNNLDGDWLSDNDKNIALWGAPSGTTNKRMFDPCPVGYAMPPRFVFSGFSSDGSGTGISSARTYYVNGEFNNGLNFYVTATDSGNTSWYPAVGLRNNSTSSITNLKYRGDYWSGSSYKNTDGEYITYRAQRLRFTSESAIWFNNDPAAKSYGLSVRCMKEVK